MRRKYALAYHIAWICKGTSKRNTAVLAICRMCRVARDMVCHTAWILILPSIWIVAVCLNAYECICNFEIACRPNIRPGRKNRSRKRRHRNSHARRFSFQFGILYPSPDLSVSFINNDIFQNVIHAHFINVYYFSKQKSIFVSFFSAKYYQF